MRKAARVTSKARKSRAGRLTETMAKDLALNELMTGGTYFDHNVDATEPSKNLKIHNDGGNYGRDTDSGNHGQDVTRDDAPVEYQASVELYGGPVTQTDSSNAYLMGALIVGGGILASRA